MFATLQYFLYCDVLLFVTRSVHSRLHEILSPASLPYLMTPPTVHVTSEDRVGRGESPWPTCPPLTMTKSGGCEDKWPSLCAPLAAVPPACSAPACPRNPASRMPALLGRARTAPAPPGPRVARRQGLSFSSHQLPQACLAAPTASVMTDCQLFLRNQTALFIGATAPAPVRAVQRKITFQSFIVRAFVKNKYL